MNDNTVKASTMDKGFKGTSMAILAGTNTSNATTNYGKPLSKDVTTGWTAAGPGLSSDTLTLAGMSLKQGDQTDTYVLSMSIDSAKGNPNFLKNGSFAIVTRDGGNWVNAVNKNYGGTSTFVSGPWNSSYALSTYGLDTATNTVWAVLDYNGDFAIEQTKGNK